MVDNKNLLSEFREKLATLEKAQSVLGDVLFAEMKRALLAQYRIDTGGGDFFGEIKVNHGDVVVRDKHVHLNFATDSLDKLCQSYYRTLASECWKLPLGLIDEDFAKPGKVGKVRLDAVYVDLDVIAPLREEIENLHSWGLRQVWSEEGVRTPLLEALSQPSAVRVVLIGDAGSGKTTFVNYLTAVLAKKVAGTAVPELSNPFLGNLPVRLLLREVATRIPAGSDEGTAEMLWGALREDIDHLLGPTMAERLFPYLQERLLNEGGIFLLDGLDEVPEAGGRRSCLLQAVNILLNSLPEGSRFILTSRPYAYSDPALQLSEIPILDLAPFNERQIERFVNYWYVAIRPALGWSEKIAEERAARLMNALQLRPYLVDLASRPLLLTLMATLHSSKGQLPEGRAELYEESVKLLLGRWQQSGKQLSEPEIEKVLRIGDGKIRGALEKVAFETHARQRLQDQQSEDLAAIAQAEVLAAFAEISKEVHPGLILKYLNQRAGLLIECRPGIYTFPHRSFQEYLAACYLADNEADLAETLRKLVYEDFIWWREVFLLEVGKLSLSIAAQVINVLIPRSIEKVGNFTDEDWRAAVLAGQALMELRLWERVDGKPHLEDLLERVRDWLMVLVSGGHLPIKERWLAGNILGVLGDHRLGVGLRSDGLPDIDWIKISGGFFVMGSREDEPEAVENEISRGIINLPRYHISRYLITNAQFRPFVESDGYNNMEYWTIDGWKWREGDQIGLSVLEESLKNVDPSAVIEYPRDLLENYRNLLAWRTPEKRGYPAGWNDPQWNMPNYPVVGITWYEAVAYCAWLSRQLNRAVRLPSEAEWEKAARGSELEDKRYPWGMEWQDGLANTKETGLGQTSAVGMFPMSAGAYKVHDIVGNVWEWTRSRYGNHNISQCDYPYPYIPEDGREYAQGIKLPVLRGGSWFDGARCVRCAYRDWFVPDYYNFNVGFRIVLLSPL